MTSNEQHDSSSAAAATAATTAVAGTSRERLKETFSTRMLQVVTLCETTSLTTSKIEHDEAEIDLRGHTFQVFVDEPEIDLTSWTDQEIEEEMVDIAKTPKLQTATVLIAALKIKPDKTSTVSLPTALTNDAHGANHHTTGICAAPSCKKPAFTSKHISWCEEHEQALVDPIRKDFESKRLTWPQWLQDWVSSFEESSLSIDEAHRLLYEVAVPKLHEISRYLEKDSTNKEDARISNKECQQILGAIGTYKARFNPLPGVVLFLVELALLFIVAFYRAFGLPATAAVTAFCAVAATALITTVIGVGIWRARTFFLKLGCGALVGAGVGTLVLGPLGGAAGALIGAGVTGLLNNPKNMEPYKEKGRWLS